jgi:hypothetical protein
LCGLASPVEYSLELDLKRTSLQRMARTYAVAHMLPSAGIVALAAVVVLAVADVEVVALIVVHLVNGTLLVRLEPVAHIVAAGRKHMTEVAVVHLTAIFAVWELRMLLVVVKGLHGRVVGIELLLLVAFEVAAVVVLGSDPGSSMAFPLAEVVHPLIRQHPSQLLQQPLLAIIYIKIVLQQKVS